MDDDVILLSAIDKSRALELIKRIEDLKDKLNSSTNQLKRIQAACQHSWGETVYDPIVREAYTIPGDQPGTMGVDWRGSTYVPRKEKPRWKRTCHICRLTEYTEKADDKITKMSDFK